jgi:hypothetical protein
MLMIVFGVSIGTLLGVAAFVVGVYVRGGTWLARIGFPVTRRRRQLLVGSWPAVATSVRQLTGTQFITLNPATLIEGGANTSASGGGGTIPMLIQIPAQTVAAATAAQTDKS